MFEFEKCLKSVACMIELFILRLAGDERYVVHLSLQKLSSVWLLCCDKSLSEAGWILYEPQLLEI